MDPRDQYDAPSGIDLERADFDEDGYPLDPLDEGDATSAPEGEEGY